jgi:menaquinone-specific isochorismate synthase
MKDFISVSASSFSQFLSEITAQKKETSNTLVVSFAVPLQNFDLEKKLDYFVKLYECSFYYELPEKGYSFLALDEIFTISENGQRRFVATGKKIQEWKNNLITNWKTLKINKVPVFVGGMKFTIEHSDTDWKDFNDSTWFIPEILLLKEHDHIYLLFFTLLPPKTSIEKVVERYRTKLESIINNEEKPDDSYHPKLTNTMGSSPKDKKKWKILLDQALEKIHENNLSKVVLSRKVEMVLASELNMSYAMQSLRNYYPDCCLYIYHRGKSSFFGATPEMLALFSKNKIELIAMAGSARRGKTEKEDLQEEKELIKSQKNLNEHKYVVDDIKNSISNFTSNFSCSINPIVKKLTNIQHLSSNISADINPGVTLMNLLKEIHPTPAVCGYPRESALNFIKKSESHQRGLYSGIIGWFNLTDEGEFAVAIRSALTYNNKLIAYVGGGIVEGSDPEDEFEETEMKLKAITSLFINENKN